jgi:Trk-type K+ transport system membrane component
LIEHRRIKKHAHQLAPRLSLFTKIALLGFIVVTLIGITFSFILEYTYTTYTTKSYYDIAHYQAVNGEFGKCDTLNRIWAIIFNSMNTRSVGMYTVNATILSPGSQ